MKTQQQEFALRVSVATVRGALLALVLMQAARADDAAQEASVKELTTPAKTIEAGAGWVSRDSFKFGEYNGLESKGIYGIGNLDLRGGGSYDSNDASRWSLTGRNLGLDVREGRIEYGRQGLFRLNLGYDELLHNEDNRYQTPYLGAGGTNLVLPASWRTPTYPTSATMGAGNTFPSPAATFLGLAATGYGSPLVANTAYVCRSTTNGCAINPALGGTLGSIYTVGLPVTAANTAMLARNATDLGDFHPVALSTKRQKFDAGASYEIDRRMEVTFSFRQERKDGLRDQGVVNAGNGPSGTLAGENAVIFPKLIDTVTDQYNAAFNFTDKKGFATFAYYGSIFTNNVKSMTIANPWALGPTAATNAYSVSSATMSEEPDNQLHQFKLTGGYNLLPGTKAVLDASYSRNTQNDAFVLDPAMFQTPTLNGAAVTGAALNNAAYSPTGSANALVVNKAFDLKLTSRPFNRISLTGDYKYDNRDNQTPVHSFVWYDAGAKNIGAATGGAASPLNGATIPGVPSTLPLYSGVNVVDNRPYSKTVNQADLDAEISLVPGHALKVGYTYQSIDRYCNGTWIDCSFADQTRENTLKTEYRFTAGEKVSGRIGFDQSTRSVTYNPNAWMSLAPALSATNIASLTAQGYTGSVLGFLNTYGLTANGLPITANTPVPIAAIAGSPQLTAIYNALFGNGNGSLSNNYYANHNVTNNWSGLDVYNMSDRDRSRVRGSVNWEATEVLGLQAGFDYRHDNYPSNAFGLESAEAWSLNFDGAFTPSEDFALDAYYTHEDDRSRSGGDSASNGPVSRNAATGTAYTTATGATGTNTGVAGLCASDSTAGLAANATPYQIYNNNLKIDPCAGWNANMRDRADTIGLSFTRKNFVSRRFTLSGDISATRAVTTNNMTGGFYYANPLAAFAANVPAVFFINAVALPQIDTSISHFGLSGRYQLDKASALRVSWSVNWLHTNDYVYQTTQPATTSGSVMPTLDTPQNYVVNVFGLVYSYTFR
jgi:hypothetical protein